MPIYEYLCPICETQFERMRPMSLWDMPATCPQGHSDCRRVPSRIVAFSKDEFGDVTAVGRVDSSLYVPDYDCSSLWTREPVPGWDYTVDPESGRITMCDDKTPPS